MPDKIFLETYPLYRKFQFTFEPFVRELPQPPINRHCVADCRSVQTFAARHRWSGDVNENDDPAGRILSVTYKCLGCGADKVQFLVRFGEGHNVIYKIGQWPTWDIAPDPLLSAVLDEEGHQLLKKGLICESQGFGIGAFGYYRRILERAIGSLLDQIAEVLEGDSLAIYKEALAKTKAETIAANRIELVKDMLPESLRSKGVNPLDILYQVASEGIHEMSDDECLDNADALRESMTFLFDQLYRTRNAKVTFSQHMQKFLDRRAAKGTNT